MLLFLEGQDKIAKKLNANLIGGEKINLLKMRYWLSKVKNNLVEQSFFVLLGLTLFPG